LLPWREARRKARASTLACWEAWGGARAPDRRRGAPDHCRYIACKADRNEFLKRENVRLDKEIEEIKKLKSEIAALLARKQIIERLQADRAQAVYLLQELVSRCRWRVPQDDQTNGLKSTWLATRNRTPASRP